MDALKARWAALWQRLGLPEPEGLCQALLDAYGEPQRHYHTLQHLGECLALADKFKAEAERFEEVELALWFHDAVYDVRAHDNEARSAQWAATALREAGLDEQACARIHDLVMATCHGTLPGTPDAALLTDIDLSILGASEPRFAEYEEQIRAEYAWVAPDVYAVKRRAVLRGFLERVHIYATPAVRSRFEEEARRHLSRAIVLPELPA